MITREQRRQRRRFTRLVLLIFGIVAVSFMLFNLFVKQGMISVQIKSLSLKDAVENSLKEASGTYGVAILNLKTGKSLYINEHKSFETGSLYKLWVMAVSFRQIQEGKLSEDEALIGDIASLNEKFNIASDSAEFTQGKISLTVKSAIQQMITISHNYAALMLTEKIKLSSVAAFLKENGFSESAIGTGGDSPESTASDIALFYEKLYKGQLANEQYTLEMINLLKNQQLDEGLPKYLPAGVKTAHKTGEIGWFKHDAGIIFTEKGDYILAVMSESKSPAGAQEKIAEISKSVYDYFK